MGELYKRGRIWWADYVDRDGERVRKSTKFRQKDKAEEVLKAWELNERMIQLEVRLPNKAKEPLEDTLKDYQASLRTAGKSEDHIERTGRFVRAVALHNGWTTLGQISADGLNKYTEKIKTERDAAARTIGSVITAVRSFCRWCVRTRKMAADPTAAVDKPKIATDRRIERMLLPDEWKWLKAYLERSKLERNGQMPAERLLMYRVAIETGLRSSELRSLKRSSLHLNGGEPYLLVKASLTKNSQQAKQYLSDSLAADLSKRTAARAASAMVFTVDSPHEMARTLRADIEAAHQMWMDSLTDKQKEKADSDFLKSPNSQGEVLDFHALRHTCGAWLVMRGITLPEVQEIMRHSGIQLTIDTYGHLAPDARSKSRNVLGEML